jgi:serine/threonine protein kinase/formylglycine-generating enzyme required for sulfatase activity
MTDPDETIPFQEKLTDGPRVPVVPADRPGRIGRYQVEKLLGDGHFGRVYLARDEQLQRLVAVKVPHQTLVSRVEEATAYLTEARAVATLDHPHIVPVFDVGCTDEWPCFIVSKYIDGSSLETLIKKRRPPLREAVELVAAIAEALQFAHREGLVHRDVKPGNILVDANNKPYLADFGLALKDEEFGTGPTWAGTPAYMSPEQARCEGHRVDGRSDVFSLGVVFYELLTGRHPFKASSRDEVIERIKTMEPRPLRQIDENIPKEIERICFKALAKRAVERYMTAKDMADDLRYFLAQQTVGLQPASSGHSVAPSTEAPAGPTPSTMVTSSRLSAPGSTASARTSHGPLLRIVPKGLRSFDVHDADFFLELLPGPRDRDGLPDSIRFWKSCVEESDPDNTFSVGLIYGPSGCGKSSLVKAGLLPRLAADVLPVYVEATANETESRLLHGLGKVCPTLTPQLVPQATGGGSNGLRETVAALRRGQWVPKGKKVLIVLDQFEQWLHAKREEQNTQLVQALRQCDGGRLQCMLLVRDDFWLAVTRFFGELEIDLLQGHNTAPADLFDLDHARNVLAAFGRAFGRLPENPRDMTKEHKEFLKSAISDLAQEGKVICVRLALFAEMLKGKPWIPATLREVGGTEGLGVTFLEETFSSTAANPTHRLHQRAARAVLAALLPESGTDIRGHLRSRGELLVASGYAARPKAFDDLIRILDSELRLITPTEAEAVAGSELTMDHSPQTTCYYQLTHDFLVPSLRDWLSRKQKETRRGRAALALADRASIWHIRPENRQLPSFPQWLNIRMLTRKENWTEPQRRMMRRASRYHAVRGSALLGLLLVVALISWGVWQQVNQQRQADHAADLVRHLLDANIAQVPSILSEIKGHRLWADPLLRDQNQKAEPYSSQKLRTSLALLSVDPTQVEYLYQTLLFHSNPDAVPVIRDALFPQREALIDRLWRVLEQPDPGTEGQRLRAGALLALYDPDSPRWEKCSAGVVEELVAENVIFLGLWMEAFRPVKARLLGSLSTVFRDTKLERTSERNSATSILAAYVADQPDRLADLLMDADPKQFAVLFPKLKGLGDRGAIFLEREIGKHLAPDTRADSKDRLDQRQANAAVALLEMGRADTVWPLLKHSQDPSVRSYLIHRLGLYEADPLAIINRLHTEKDLEIRRALLLSLGEFGESQLSVAKRTEIMPTLFEEYRSTPDPGIHSAVEWLLRQWKQDHELEQFYKGWAKDKKSKEQALLRIRQELTDEKEKAKPRWYVTGQGQTMVVLAGPVTFLMGSPPSEAGRSANEHLHCRSIRHSFAIASKAVTLEQFLRFDKDYNYEPLFAPTKDCPACGMTWYAAAEYCNWLSEQEGLPKEEWCFEPNTHDKYDEGMRLAPDCLKRTGYRLPTEAEWEYACRAGSVTSRYYGESDRLLEKYGWYLVNANNRSWPVGIMKPNDWGLFDMHGNSWTWCLERYYKDFAISTGGRSEGVLDGMLDVSSKDDRPNRGGSFGTHASDVRSASRGEFLPTAPIKSIGFRPARTIR